MTKQKRLNTIVNMKFFFFLFCLSTISSTCVNAAETYRYLKINITEASSVSMREVEWISNDISYPTQAITVSNAANSVGEAIADPQEETPNYWTLYNAFDKKYDGNLYAAGDALPQPITLDIGEGNAITPEKLKIIIDDNGWALINDFEVLVSNDNSTWTTIKSFSDLTATDWVQAGGE